MRILKEDKSVFNEKYNRAYYLYSDIFEISIKKVTEIIIIDTISRNYLNFIKKLFNVLIR